MESNVQKIRELVGTILEICTPIRTGDEDDPIERIALLAEEARAIPLRNCDKFSDWWEANKAWRALPRDDLGYFVKQNGVLLCEIAWLFETEQKGE